MNSMLKFEGITVDIIEINGQAMFEVYSTGMALGQSKVSKGITYPRTERIDQNLKNAEITPVVHNGQLYINESQLYDFMLEAKTQKCKAFRKWVTSEVLPQIRQTGGYIPLTKDDDEKTIMAKGYMVAIKTIEVKDELIKQLQPKADEYDTFIHSKGYISLNKTAKALKVGRNKMMAFLRHWSILFIDGQDNLPYQKYVSAGYFTIDCHVGRDGKVHATTRVSPKGVSFIHKLYLKYAPSIERTVA